MPATINPGSLPARCVSVILPTYNRSALLAEAIESVLAQRGLPAGLTVEILVVDDGSTDETELVVRGFGSRVRYLRQTNGGVARARNTGIAHAQGELICFLDSDDLWLSDKLARQLEAADAEPEVALFATEICSFSEKGEIAARAKAALYTIRDGWAVEGLLFANWIQTSTVMVRADALRQVVGFDEDVGQFGEDWLLWVRIASFARVRFLREPLVRYRVHEVSLMSDRPDAQFASLMLILDRIARLPPFVRKPHLIRQARYRVCMLRGRRDLAAGDLARASAKLRLACGLRWLPVAAWVGLASVWARAAAQRRFASGGRI